MGREKKAKQRQDSEGGTFRQNLFLAPSEAEALTTRLGLRPKATLIAGAWDFDGGRRLTYSLRKGTVTVDHWIPNAAARVEVVAGDLGSLSKLLALVGGNSFDAVDRFSPPPWPCADDLDDFDEGLD